ARTCWRRRWALRLALSPARGIRSPVSARAGLCICFWCWGGFSCCYCHCSGDNVYLNTDVLIVGAGPTGLMLANQLARRGVRAIIIDRHAGPALQTRALGVQARTLEIYAQLGIADRALELGKRATGAN